MARLGIYIQIPFCQTKCTYCNFHTGVVSSSRFAPYVNAVCAEIGRHRDFYEPAGVHVPRSLADALADTVYFGGGTPSLLDPVHLQRMLEVIRASFASFSDAELKATGRMHRRADIYRAVPILRDAGIRSISFDLIAGLPGQTRESWRNSLDELTALGPEHVSIYLLEIDEGSHLGAEVLRGGAKYGAGTIPSEDDMAEFYETACKFLQQAGYRHYEISNWGKAGFESRHNLKYWQREPYLGFGAGAHSFSGTQRWANAHDAAAYVSAIKSGRLPVEQLEAVTPESALEEELFLGLRQLDGIDVGRIEREYGVAVTPRFDRLMSAGMVERNGNVVRLTESKLSAANEVFVELMK
jgi:oxygen-independent coproporphyrinogen-3 oxidase